AVDVTGERRLLGALSDDTERRPIDGRVHRRRPVGAEAGETGPGRSVATWAGSEAREPLDETPAERGGRRRSRELFGSGDLRDHGRETGSIRGSAQARSRVGERHGGAAVTRRFVQGSTG